MEDYAQRTLITSESGLSIPGTGTAVVVVVVTVAVVIGRLVTAQPLTIFVNNKIHQ